MGSYPHWCTHVINKLITYSNFSDDLIDAVLDTEEYSGPLDVAQLRDRAMKKIAKQEAAGLLNQSVFLQDKRGKAKGRKK